MNKLTEAEWKEILHELRMFYLSSGSFPTEAQDAKCEASYDFVLEMTSAFNATVRHGAAFEHEDLPEKCKYCPYRTRDCCVLIRSLSRHLTAYPIMEIRRQIERHKILAKLS